MIMIIPADIDVFNTVIMYGNRIDITNIINSIFVRYLPNELFNMTQLFAIVFCCSDISMYKHPRRKNLVNLRARS